MYGSDSPGGDSGAPGGGSGGPGGGSGGPIRGGTPRGGPYSSVTAKRRAQGPVLWGVGILFSVYGITVPYMP